MTILQYIKDKSLFLIINLVLFFIVFIISIYINLSFELVIGIFILWFFPLISYIILEFIKFKKYYEKVEGICDGLDKKYLLSEVIEEPEFPEGKILYDLLSETNRSMRENINYYRNIQKEYEEYIEMWVHEIKLPVASLLLMLHNHKSELSPKFAEQLRKIDGFTDTVLYYARIDNAEKDYIIKEYNLKKVVSNTIKKYREELLLHNVSLHSDIPDIAVMTDGKWLEFILGQFITNSLKYFDSGREPEIILSAKENSESVSLIFRDNGIGIPNNDIPYIFEKTFTGQNGRTHARSTGMGLFICRRLCEKLGHSISALSVQGEYTEMIIGFAKNDFYKFS